MTESERIVSLAVRPPRRWRFLLPAILVPLAMTAFFLWLGYEYQGAERLRAHARQAFDHRIEAGRLIARLSDAESSQRGFVITGDPVFLEPFTPAEAGTMASLKKLDGTFGDEAAQKHRLDQLHGLIADKFAEMQRVIDARRAGGLSAAATLVEQGNGRRLMDRIRNVTGEMLSAEETEGARGVAAFTARSRRIAAAVWIGLVVASVALAIVLWLLWRQRMSRYRLELGTYEVLERHRAIFESTIDAFIVLNPSGSIETVNPAASELLGYSAVELERRDVSVLIDLVPRPVTFHERIGLLDGALRNPFYPDRNATHRDGHKIPVDIALGVMRLADGDHIVASVRDISARKRAERAKDDFMSSVSHELRTPLTSVVGALGLLKAGTAGKMPVAAKRLVEIAENNSRRLIRLINDMLDIDRIQSGRLTLDKQTIDLREVITHACEGGEGLAVAADVRIACNLPDYPVMVTGDSGRLLQVLANLTSNAVRVAPPKSAVTIGLDVIQDGSTARVTVDDDGPGVPVAFRDRIFGRFERPEGDESTGTGLGLAISREIVMRHDGRLWFEDRPAGGTRFVFTLDLVREVAPQTITGGTPILICEDDDDVAELLREMVAAMGYSSHRVGTVAAARTALAEGDYAALLLDLNLPDESGLNLARTLLNTDGDSTVPIVVVSALRRDGMAEPIPLDIVDWIEKPVDPTRLASAIRAAVGRSGIVRPTVLHLDDDRDMLDIVETALMTDARILKAPDLFSARALLRSESPDVAILDLHLAEGSGLDLLPMLVDNEGVGIPTIIYSAHDVSVDAARRVDAVLVKSRETLPDLKATIRKVLDRREKGVRE